MNKIADGWIQATEIWCQKQQLYQLRYNNCPTKMSLAVTDQPDSVK